jgi:osmotically-inducible protein OsmY
MAHEPEVVAAPQISDLDLRDAIEQGLWNLDAVRITKPVLDIKVDGGHAIVSGVVASPMIREEIEDALNGLPVTISLADDAGIQYAASYALAMNADTCDVSTGAQVTSINGHVYVRGKFTAEQAQAITEVVSAVPSAKGVSIKD